MARRSRPASKRTEGSMIITTATMVDTLLRHVTERPDAVAYTFLLDGESDESNVTYVELDRQARAIAARLQEMTAPGDRVLLLYPPGLDYVAGFFGCLYADVVAD